MPYMETIDMTVERPTTSDRQRFLYPSIHGKSFLTFVTPNRRLVCWSGEVGSMVVVDELTSEGDVGLLHGRAAHGPMIDSRRIPPEVCIQFEFNGRQEKSA